MATREPRVERDGMIDYLGGVDCGRSPSLLAANELAWGENVTVRGGYPATRPPISRVPIEFSDEAHAEVFASGVFQGATVFSNRIIMQVGGRVFSIYPTTREVSESTPNLIILTTADAVSPPIGDSVTFNVADASQVEVGFPMFIGKGQMLVTSKTATTIVAENISITPGVSVPSSSALLVLDRSDPTEPNCWMQESDGYLVIQNNIDRAIIFDKSSGLWRRSSIQEKEVPTGSVMAYGLGRLWVALNSGEFVAGDIAGGPTPVVKFTENEFISSGGAFRVPSGSGRITAMEFVSNLDTSLGQGPLLVSTSTEMFSVNAPVSRDVWQDLQNPIQTVSLKPYGAQSAWSMVIVNGDMFFRSRDGIRSLVLARREFETWGNVPITRQMQKVLGYDDESLLGSASGVLFDNRMLMLVNPVRSGPTIYHSSIAVLDFDLISTLRAKAPPVWEGIWTGLKFLRLFAGEIDGVYRCFAVATGDDGISIWEILKSGNFDDECVKIKCAIETRAVNWRDPLSLHRLSAGELWVDSLRGDIDYTIKHKPDQNPCWYPWHTFALRQKYQDCSTDQCDGPTTFLPGYRTRLMLYAPPMASNEQDDRVSTDAFEQQVRIEWDGAARIRKLILKAEIVEEPPFGAKTSG